jgi:diketogulonate reductase-like aldo/keto reductase
MSDILARDNITIAVNQVEYSILRQLPDKSGLMAEMKKRGITCLGCRYPLQVWVDQAHARLAISDGPLDGKVQRR